MSRQSFPHISAPVAQALWQRIRAHPFEQPAQPRDFLRCLAREQGWSLTDARAAIEEYRRFCCLQTLCTQPLSPSAAVDQVWHLHLTWSIDYWQRWCPQVLQRPLHHQPATGAEPAGQFLEQYARTLAFYEQVFGSPPLRWWPATSRQLRQAAHPRWVDPAKAWIIAKPDWTRWRARLSSPRLALSLLALGLPGSAVALGINPLDWPAGTFLLFFVGGALLLGWLGRLWLRLQLRARSSQPLVTLDPLQAAALAGGPMRVVDTHLTQALHDGVVVFHPSTAEVLRGSTAPSAQQELLARLAAQPVDLPLLRLQLEHVGDEVVGGLQRRGLCVPPERAAQLAARSTWPLQLWLLLGVAKVLVGMDRDWPVDILIALCVVLVIWTWVLRGKRPRLTAQGEQALQAVRQRHLRLRRAPLGHELPMAVALLGTSVLVGSAYAELHRSNSAADRQDSDRKDSGCGDSGSDGDGGGGGCGGGD